MYTGKNLTAAEEAAFFSDGEWESEHDENRPAEIANNHSTTLARRELGKPLLPAPSCTTTSNPTALTTSSVRSKVNQVTCQPRASCAIADALLDYLDEHNMKLPVDTDALASLKVPAGKVSRKRPSTSSTDQTRATAVKRPLEPPLRRPENKDATSSTTYQRSPAPTSAASCAAPYSTVRDHRCARIVPPYKPAPLSETYCMSPYRDYPQFEDIFQQLVRHEDEHWLLVVLQHHRDERIETKDAERRCKLLVTVRQAQFNVELWGRRIAAFSSKIGEIDEVERAKVLSNEAQARKRKLDDNDGDGPSEGRVSKKRAS